jgi:hypothetical protein
MVVVLLGWLWPRTRPLLGGLRRGERGRLLLVVLVILALGRPQLVWRDRLGPPAIVLCLDETLSTGGRGARQASALRERHPHAPTVRIGSEEPSTDLAGLLGAGAARLPPAGGTLVLVSDGCHHGTPLAATLDALARQNVQVEVIAVPPPPPAPRLVGVRLPQGPFPPGGRLRLQVTLAGGPAPAAVAARLGSGEVVTSPTVDLEAWRHRHLELELPVPARPGRYDLEVAVQATRVAPQAGACQVVLQVDVAPGPPVALLGSARLPGPAGLPVELTEDWTGQPGSLLRYRAVVLAGPVGSHPGTLSPREAAALAAAVARGEAGLILQGGEASFGAGSWLGTPLAALSPLDPDPGDRPRASVLVLADRSGSMGPADVELTREALHQLLESLAPGDLWCVLPYAATVSDSGPLARPVEVPADRDARRGIEVLLDEAYPLGQGRGGTALGPALQQGLAVLSDTTTSRRLLLAITDAELVAEDLQLVYQELRARPGEVEVTLVLTGAGGGLAPSALARAGVDDVEVVAASEGALTEVLARAFNEATQDRWIAAGRFAITAAGDAASSGALARLNRTRERREAPAELFAGDLPLVACWRRGRGRVCAVAGRPGPAPWGGGPLDDPGFWRQLVDRVTAAGEGMTVNASLTRSGRIEVEVGGDPASAQLAGPVRVQVVPGGEPIPGRLVDIGRWRADLPVTRAGTVLVRATDGVREGLAAVHVAVPLEWREVRPDLELLGSIAAATGGSVWMELPPAGLVSTRSGAERRALWPWLLLVAACLVASGRAAVSGFSARRAAASV